MRNVGRSLHDIDSVYITHLHADHCYGLERLAYERLLTPKPQRPILFAEGDVVDQLWNGVLKTVCSPMAEGPRNIKDFFEVRTVENGCFQAGNHRIKTFQVPHTPGKKCHAVVINNDIVITGDTRPIGDQLGAMSPRLVIHDCLSMENPVHSDLRTLERDYPAWLKTRTWLTGYDDALTDAIARKAGFAGAAQCGQQFKVRNTFEESARKNE